MKDSAITVNKHDILNLIRTNIRDKKEFPTLHDVTSKLMLSIPEARRSMDELVDKGLLSKAGGWYRLAFSLESASLFENLDEDKPVVLDDNRDLPKKIITYVMGVIGLGASILSIYYTTIWLRDFLPSGLAILLSTVMSFFSILVFQTLMIILYEKIKILIKGTIFSILFSLWIIVTLFSISSTIAGQYNVYYSSLKEDSNLEERDTRVKIKGIEQKEQSIEERMKFLKDKRDYLYGLLKQWKTVEEQKDNYYRWRKTQKDIEEVTQNLDTLYKEKEELGKEKEEAIESSSIVLSESNEKETIPDFYSWISNVLHIGKEKVRFWMSLFPAVFIDIVAPISFAISILIDNTRRKR